MTLLFKGPTEVFIISKSSTRKHDINHKLKELAGGSQLTTIYKKMLPGQEDKNYALVVLGNNWRVYHLQEALLGNMTLTTNLMGIKCKLEVMS